MSRTFLRDFTVEVIKGKIPGHRIFQALGERVSLGAGSAYGEDTWRGNELSPAPTSHTSIPIPDAAGEQMALVSEDAADTAAGIGAQTVEIHYLDALGEEQITEVVMDGTTPVDLAPSDVRFVQEMNVKTVGSNVVSMGHIKIHKSDTAGLVYSMITAGGNMSLVPSKMVPVDKCLYLRTWAACEAQGRQVAVRMRADCNNEQPPIRQAGVFLFKSVAYLNGSTPGDISLVYCIPALSIIKVSGWPELAGSSVSVHWWGVLVDD